MRPPSSWVAVPALNEHAGQSACVVRCPWHVWNALDRSHSRPRRILQRACIEQVVCFLVSACWLEACILIGSSTVNQTRPNPCWAWCSRCLQALARFPTLRLKDPDVQARIAEELRPFQAPCVSRQTGNAQSRRKEWTGMVLSPSLPRSTRARPASNESVNAHESCHRRRE